MNTQNNFVEIQDAQLQERVLILIEDRTQTAEQVLNEQAAEHNVDKTSAPRYLP
jgi:hypothetical protein